MIARRTQRLCIALLLPLLVLRAMLPAGFMPVADDAGLRIVMCSAGMAAWTGEGTDAPQHKLPPNAGECPFAHAPAGAPPVDFSLPQPGVTPASFVVPDPDSLFPTATRARSHVARGPPRFS
jgi:hypothetical protein